ncbi:Protein serrate [Dufourea novaeangliae]|nr:Protein serrate [Dufourea novaeangliae]
MEPVSLEKRDEKKKEGTNDHDAAHRCPTSTAVRGRFNELEDPRRGINLIIEFVVLQRQFTLILQARDEASAGVIEEASYSGIVLPGPTWHTLNHQGRNAHLAYRVRVQCADHYYNATCTKFCRPRNDIFGHYTCDKNGDKVCIQGWKGSDCEIDKTAESNNFDRLEATLYKNEQYQNSNRCRKYPYGEERGRTSPWTPEYSNRLTMQEDHIIVPQLDTFHFRRQHKEEEGRRGEPN